MLTCGGHGELVTLISRDVPGREEDPSGVNGSDGGRTEVGATKIVKFMAGHMGYECVVDLMEDTAFQAQVDVND